MRRPAEEAHAGIPVTDRPYIDKGMDTHAGK